MDMAKGQDTKNEILRIALDMAKGLIIPSTLQGESTAIQLLLYCNRRMRADSLMIFCLSQQPKVAGSNPASPTIKNSCSKTDAKITKPSIAER